MRDKLIAYCRQMPHATEDVKWGDDLIFSIGQKMFAGFSVKDEGDGLCGFKCSEDDYHKLIELEGVIPAPYAARFHWVSVKKKSQLQLKDIQDLIQKSYDIVFSKLPKKVQRELNQ